MIKDKLSLSKIILILTIFISLGTALGVVGYLIKNNSNIDQQPRILPTITPEPITSVKNDNFIEVQLENLKEGKNNLGGVSFEFQADPKEFSVGDNKYVIKEGEYGCGAYQCSTGYDVYMINKKGKLIPVEDLRGNSFGLFKIEYMGDQFLFMNYDNLLHVFSVNTAKPAGRCMAVTSVYLTIINGESVISEQDFEGVIRLMVKDGKLYIKAENNFCYESYTCSIPSLPPEIKANCDCNVTDGTFPCADQYYLIEKGNITNADLEFKSQYLDQINKYNDQLENTNWTDEPGGEKWFNPLMERTLNYIFAGDKDTAWETFYNDSGDLSKKHPLEVKVDASNIRKQVEDKLTQKIR